MDLRNPHNNLFHKDTYCLLINIDTDKLIHDSVYFYQCESYHLLLEDPEFIAMEEVIDLTLTPPLAPRCDFEGVFIYLLFI